MTNEQTLLNEDNPLTQFRLTLNLSQIELAVEVGVSPVIIQLHELGIPHHLHPKLLKRFPSLVELIPGYQEFRLRRRRRNFRGYRCVVPQNGPEFRGMLDEWGMSPAEFSEKACMPLIDINFALHHWRIPITLIKFFEEVCSDSEPN
jgi:hypothetical protein